MLKYGDSKTYNYKFTKEETEWLDKNVNRSKGQRLFLFQLVDGDFELYKLLEKKMKDGFFNYCPDNKEEVEKIMSS